MKKKAGEHKRSNAKSGKSKIRGFPYSSEIIELRKELKLTEHEVLLLHTLRGSMNAKNISCWKTVKTLAEEMGCSRYTIMRAGNNLKEQGIIEVTQEIRKRKHGQATFLHNVYRLISPWSEESRSKQIEKLEQARKKEACLAAEKHLPSRSKQHVPSRSQQHVPVAHSDPNQSKGIYQGFNKSSKKNTDSENLSSLTDKNPVISREKIKPSLPLPKADMGKISRLRRKLERLGPPDDWNEKQNAIREEIRREEEEEKKRVIEDFHAGKFDFSAFCAPYKDRDDLDTPRYSYQERLIEEFWEQMVDRFWNKKHPIKGGVKRLFFRACRDGAAAEFGLTLL